MSNIVLDDLRSKIDEIDTKLCQLIKERQSLASKIMSAKKGGFPFDPKSYFCLSKQFLQEIG